MSGQEIKILGRRLMMLATLIACLIAFSGEKKAVVLSCCDTCNTNYALCFQACNGDTACQETCGDKFDACELRCWQFHHQLC
jgi:hypothetical protein